LSSLYLNEEIEQWHILSLRTWPNRTAPRDLRASDCSEVTVR